MRAGQRRLLGLEEVHDDEVGLLDAPRLEDQALPGVERIVAEAQRLLESR